MTSHIGGASARAPSWVRECCSRARAGASSAALPDSRRRLIRTRDSPGLPRLARAFDTSARPHCPPIVVRSSSPRIATALVHITSLGSNPRFHAVQANIGKHAMAEGAQSTLQKGLDGLALGAGPDTIPSQSAPSAATTSAITSAAAGSAAGGDEDPLVQHVVIRKDLVDTLKWPLGSVIAQGCHAAVAAVWEHRADPTTEAYCTALDSMRKVVLEVKNEGQLRDLSAKLTSAGIAHKLWIEQPEDYATCLATRPHLKSVAAPFFKKLRLCR